MRARRGASLLLAVWLVATVAGATPWSSETPGPTATPTPGLSATPTLGQHYPPAAATTVPTATATTGSDRKPTTNGKTIEQLAQEVKDANSATTKQNSRIALVGMGLLGGLMLLAFGLWGLNKRLNLLSDRATLLEARPGAPAVPADLSQTLERLEQVGNQLQERLSDLEGPIQKAVGAMATSPPIRLLGSGFEGFARLVMEERTRQHGGEALTALTTAITRAGQFREAFHEVLQQTVKALGPTAPEPSRRSYAQLVSIYRKAEEAEQSLKKIGESLVPTTGIGLLEGPTFEEHCQRLLSEPARLEQLSNQAGGMFSSLIEDYSRLLAGRLQEALRGELPTVEPEAVRRSLGEWIQSHLLPLDDYLIQYGRDLEGDTAGCMEGAIRDVQALFDEVCLGLSVRKMVIRLNEDYLEPQDHEVFRRVSQEQKIRKVERHGFTWDHKLLRKAAVWI